MFKRMNKSTINMGAALTAGLVMSSNQAHANNFGNIAKNISDSIASIPGLLTGLAYLFGILLGVLGILKIKDHVENPSQTPLKDGAIRLAAGGALFALPIIYDAMFTTIGKGSVISAANLQAVSFNVGG